MIGTEQKSFDEILQLLEGKTKVVIVGCGDCATSCQTGGEKQVLAMAEKLTQQGKIITDTGVIEVTCDKRLTKKFLREHKKQVEKSDAVLVLACGSGIQTMADSTEKHVLPGLNSLFVGQIENLSRFYEYCSVCGECVLGDTGGICPVTRCAKGLINGPCGGSDQGKCEADRNNDCAWYLIYERMKKSGQLNRFTVRRERRSHAASHKPRKIEIKRH